VINNAGKLRQHAKCVTYIEGDATELAKKKFCEAKSLCNWSLHADRIHVREADFPS